MELMMGPLLALAVLVAMGFHVPRESERAVIFRFGRVARGLVGRGEERVPAAKCNAPSPSKLRRSASAEPKSSMRRANEMDGPLVFDNAMSRDTAQIEEINSTVAAEVDILPAPDLDAGNILAKNMAYLAGATLAGIVIGARVPLILTSGSDPPPLPCCSGSVGMATAYRPSLHPLQEITYDHCKRTSDHHRAHGATGQGHPRRRREPPHYRQALYADQC